MKKLFQIILLSLIVISCSENNMSDKILHILGPDSIKISEKETIFLAGVNYPWLHYGHDFGIAQMGSSSWEYDGICSEKSLQMVTKQLEQLHNNNIRFLRIFLFCDGRASPDFDGNGFVTGFDSLFYNDFDTLLSIADNYDIRLIVSLLDYTLLSYSELINGIKLFGNVDLISNLSKRKTFLENCLTTFVERYALADAIIAFELMNEPEWRIIELAGKDYQTSISLNQMKSFFKDCIKTIRQNSNKLITIGCSNYKFLKYWYDLELNFYSVHTYSSKANEPPFILKTDFNESKKIIIGEFPTLSSNKSQFEYYQACWNYGYAGAFAWSLNGNDNHSNFDFESFDNWQKSINR